MLEKTPELAVGVYLFEPIAVRRKGCCFVGLPVEAVYEDGTSMVDKGGVFCGGWGKIFSISIISGAVSQIEWESILGMRETVFLHLKCSGWQLEKYILYKSELLDTQFSVNYPITALIYFALFPPLWPPALFPPSPQIIAMLLRLLVPPTRLNSLQLVLLFIARYLPRT